MLRIEKPIELTTEFDLSLIAPAEDIMFFDIETTGLSSWKSGLYLIGLLTYDESWKLIQYFCEDVSDEITVLENFFTLLSSKKVLISFNGDGFDIPFLTHMAEQYGLPYSFDNVESFDILKKIRPLKKLLGLENMKLKTCEKFLGIYREDRFSGGDLINVYFQWQEDHSQDKLECLLLHNFEDIENMPHILPILNYLYALTGSFSLHSQEIVEHPTEKRKVLSLTYETSVTVPVPLDIKLDNWFMNLSDTDLNLCADLYEGELKFFYPNHTDYYFLPMEDRAIHRSLAEFVDRSHRKKATAKTCYQRVSGLFLPEPEPVFSPVLYREYKDKLAYTQFAPELFDDETLTEAYLRSVIKQLKLKM
ncbi:ribonuclease H-like domain-containing protein [Oribacterium sp. FC2011]|uniref:ribonuclease H-like domain-containing protein n=1 Tax=Oribacterium sp. FC2011 TaxID=1408311 RepID=UPI0004E0AFDB|nr:ribonuclease H-like domain-containing protein [Oribacterium sp. FC2011]